MQRKIQKNKRAAENALNTINYLVICVEQAANKFNRFDSHIQLNRTTDLNWLWRSYMSICFDNMCSVLSAFNRNKHIIWLLKGFRGL